MKTWKAALFAVVILSTATSTVFPAFALGDCGPNRHRDAAGQCVPGGQNEDWCVKKTGHKAERMPNGTLRCVR
jgi:hypothetical protein